MLALFCLSGCVIVRVRMHLHRCAFVRPCLDHFLDSCQLVSQSVRLWELLRRIVLEGTRLCVTVKRLTLDGSACITMVAKGGCVLVSS
jgi:hypothetical protein